MPNWCYTYLRIIGEDSKILYDKTEKWCSSPAKIPSDFGNFWLGNIVEKGLGVDPLKGPYYCRGSVCDMSFDEEAEDVTPVGLVTAPRLLVTTETAWCPMLKMWVALVKRYCPKSRIVYIAEEPGWGIYVTNDPEYKRKYNMDSFNDKIESKYCTTFDSIREAAKILGINPRLPAARLIAALSDQDVSIHRWDYERKERKYA